MLDIFRHICNGSAKINQSFSQLFRATFFKPDKLDELLLTSYQLIWAELFLTNGKISATEIVNPPIYQKKMEEKKPEG